MIDVVKLSKKSVYDLLMKCEKDFTPSLSCSIVNLDGYAEKLSKNAEFVLSSEAEENIGFLAFYKNKESGFLYIPLIWVSKKHQNRGIGQKMLNHLIENREEGIKGVRLEVRKNNENAVSFYKQSGFEIIGDHDEKYLLEKCLETN